MHTILRLSVWNTHMVAMCLIRHLRNEWGILRGGFSFHEFVCYSLYEDEIFGNTVQKDSH